MIDRSRFVDSLVVLRDEAVAKGFNDLELRLFDATLVQSRQEYMTRYPYSGDTLTRERREDYEVAMSMYVSARLLTFTASVIDGWQTKLEE